jgi:uncharacterized protein (TIGR03437 family)
MLLVCFPASAIFAQVLSVSPSQLNFTYRYGGANMPAPQTLSVTSTDPANDPVGFSAQVGSGCFNATTGLSFVFIDVPPPFGIATPTSLRLAVGGTPAAIAVAVKPVSPSTTPLPPGVYSCSVVVAAFTPNPNNILTVNVSLTVTPARWQCSAPVSAVSSGGFSSPVAPLSLISLMAENVTTQTTVVSDGYPAVLPTFLGGVSAMVNDGSGNAIPLPLIAVTPGQVNAILPPGSASGDVVLTNGAATFCGSIQVQPVSPSLFTVDQSGDGLPAAQVVITHADGSQTFSPVAQYSSTPVSNGKTTSNWVPVPIDLGSSTDVAVLELFGTGIRGVNAYIGQNGFKTLNDVVTVGSGWTVLYAGSQSRAQGTGEIGSFYGLDQVNVVLPHSLVGSGMVSLAVNAVNYCASCASTPWQMATSNTVQIDIQ